MHRAAPQPCSCHRLEGVNRGFRSYICMQPGIAPGCPGTKAVSPSQINTPVDTVNCFYKITRKSNCLGCNAAYGSLEYLLFEPGKCSCPTSNPPCIPPATAPHISPCWPQQDQLLSSNYPSCCPFAHCHVAYPLLMALLFSSSNSMYSQANIPSNMTFQKESKGLSYG